MVVVFQALDGAPVGVGITVEPQFASQQIRHVVAGTRHRHAVVAAVATHDAPGRGFRDHAGEGVEIEAAQLALATADAGAVESAGRRTVGDEMLGRAGDAGLLVAPDEGDGILGNEEGILSIGLLHTAPAGVASDLEDGRKDLAQAHRPGFRRAGGGHLSD